MSSSTYLCWRIQDDALIVELCEHEDQGPVLLSSIKIPRAVLVSGGGDGSTPLTQQEPNPK